MPSTPHISSEETPLFEAYIITGPTNMTR
uniref:Uncharacterized protein n=1 Tax=Arundo donax TaxID=35708 RepID=A0A0A9C4G2_ARUDO